MSNLPPCVCGGQANLRGGLVSMQHWVECLACGASTRLQIGYSEARSAWREGRLLKPGRSPREEVVSLRKALALQNKEICQTLGQALGYPWFKDDPVNFPDATHADGVCVGDHVAESLAAEAATTIQRLRLVIEQAGAAMDALHPDAAGDMSDGDYARLWNATRDAIEDALLSDPESHRLSGV